MKRYELFASSTPKSVEITSQILAVPTIERIALPGSIWSRYGERVRIGTPTDFSPEKIPGEWIRDTETTVGIGLDASGTSIWTTLRYRYNTFNFILKIPPEEIESGRITRDDFVQIYIGLEGVLGYLRGGSVHRRVGGDYEFRRLTKVMGLPTEVIKAPWGRQALAIDWMSYFRPESVDGLGRDRFVNLQSAFEVHPIGDGYLVILTEEPFDPYNEEHRQRELRVIEELGMLQHAVPDSPPKGKWGPMPR
jgi:hypothetical protein